MGPIVVASDLTATSERATATAVAVARACGVAVHVVHVWQPMAVAVLDAAVISSPEHVARVTAERQTALDAELASHRDAGVPLVGHLVDGEIAPEIAAYAVRVGAALIAVGATLHRGLRAALLGTTGDQIARHAPCPVLIVQAAPAQED
jgi:nucleotide-binding universal stress UspA family protein